MRSCGNAFPSVANNQLLRTPSISSLPAFSLLKRDEELHLKLSSSIFLQLLGNSRLRVKNGKMRSGAIMGIVVANKAFRTDAHSAQIAQIAENARVQEDTAIMIITIIRV